MSECIVPSWKLNQQRQEVVAAGEETNATGTAHNHPLPPPPAPAAAYVVTMSNYEVARELTWENGQVAMHGLTFPYPSLSQPAANKVPTFVRTGDTLESIVHQATHYKKSTTPNQQENDVVVNGKNAGGNVGISKKKRPRTTTTSESDHHDEYMTMKFHGNIINNNNNNNNNNNSSSSTKNIVREDRVVANNNNNSGSGGGGGAKRERSACGSASATFCRDAATSTMMTWNSFESSPRSFKTKTTDEDSACHDGASENRDEEDDETCRSRRSRAAIVHNQSERRRRDRINQKMKALQKLVPNASKTDKASMLDEVIIYLKQLQTQVHMLSTTTRSIPQMMINPLAIQQQQQQQQQISSLLARMGMGMLDINTLAPFFQQNHGINIPTPPTFLPPIHFTVPAATVHASQPNKSPAAAAAAAGVPFSDPYSVYLAQVCQQKLSALNIKQTMNMEFYNKMAALYGQKVTNQATQTTSNSSHPNFIQRE